MIAQEQLELQLTIPNISDEDVQIIGIDPGLSAVSVGLLTVQPGGVASFRYWTHKTKPKEDIVVRLAEIRYAVFKWLTPYRESVKRVGVEISFSYMGHKSTVGLLMARGAVLLGLYDLGLKRERVKHLNNSAVKKYITGKGNANKEKMIAAINDKLNLSLEDHNIADALAIAYTTLRDEEVD